MDAKLGGMTGGVKIEGAMGKDCGDIGGCNGASRREETGSEGGGGEGSGGRGAGGGGRVGGLVDGCAGAKGEEGGGGDGPGDTLGGWTG